MAGVVYWLRPSLQYPLPWHLTDFLCEASHFKKQSYEYGVDEYVLAVLCARLQTRKELFLLVLDIQTERTIERLTQKDLQLLNEIPAYQHMKMLAFKAIQAFQLRFLLFPQITFLYDPNWIDRDGIFLQSPTLTNVRKEKYDTNRGEDKSKPRIFTILSDNEKNFLPGDEVRVEPESMRRFFPIFKANFPALAGTNTRITLSFMGNESTEAFWLAVSSFYELYKPLLSVTTLCVRLESSITNDLEVYEEYVFLEKFQEKRMENQYNFSDYTVLEILNWAHGAQSWFVTYPFTKHISDFKAVVQNKLTPPLPLVLLSNAWKSKNAVLKDFHYVMMEETWRAVAPTWKPGPLYQLFLLRKKQQTDAGVQILSDQDEQLVIKAYCGSSNSELFLNNLLEMEWSQMRDYFIIEKKNYQGLLEAIKYKHCWFYTVDSQISWRKKLFSIDEKRTRKLSEQNQNSMVTWTVEVMQDIKNKLDIPQNLRPAFNNLLLQLVPIGASPQTWASSMETFLQTNASTPTHKRQKLGGCGAPLSIEEQLLKFFVSVIK